MGKEGGSKIEKGVKEGWLKMNENRWMSLPNVHVTQNEVMLYIVHR